MTYAICLLYENGSHSYLQVKNRHCWKTKKTALRHLNDCLTLLRKGRFFTGVIDCYIEEGFFI
jgi:hypothetical protein